MTTTPSGAPGPQGERLVATEVPAQRCSVELVQHLRAKRARRRDAKAIIAPAAAVEQPVAADEGAVRRASRGGVLRLRRRRQGPQNWVRRERCANRGREVCVQKPRRLGSGTGSHEGGSGGRARYSEELKRRIRLVVARVRRRALAIGEALPCEEVGRIGTARNVHDAVLVFGQQVEPTRLMMTDVAFLLQPLQAGNVYVVRRVSDRAGLTFGTRR